MKLVSGLGIVGRHPLEAPLSYLGDYTEGRLGRENMQIFQEVSAGYLFSWPTSVYELNNMLQYQY